MITLLQNSNGLIGSASDINKLKTKNHARILTISDSHGNYKLLLKIIRNFGQKCDALIFCGDGAVDLAQVLELADEDKDFNICVPSVIAFAGGNGDPSTVPVSFDIGKNNPNAKGLLKGSVIVPSQQILTVNNTNLFITHGHYFGVDFGYENLISEMKLENCKTALHGHTHVACIEKQDDCTFINPGSISRPRAAQPPCFAILTVENTFIDTAFLKITDAFGTPSYSLYNPIY